MKTIFWWSSIVIVFSLFFFYQVDVAYADHYGAGYDPNNPYDCQCGPTGDDPAMIDPANAGVTFTVTNQIPVGKTGELQPGVSGPMPPGTICATCGYGTITLSNFTVVGDFIYVDTIFTVGQDPPNSDLQNYCLNNADIAFCEIYTTYPVPPPLAPTCSAINISPVTTTSQWASWGFGTQQALNGGWRYSLTNTGSGGQTPISWSWSGSCNGGGGGGTFSATTTNPTYWTAPGLPVPTIPPGFERQFAYYHCDLSLSGRDALGRSFSCPSASYPWVDGGVQPSPSPSPSPTPTITPSPPATPIPTPRQGVISGYVYLVNETSTQNGALTYLDYTESCYTSGVTITARYTASGGGHNQGDLAGSTTFTGATNCYAGGPYQLAVPGGFSYDVIFDEANSLVNSGLTLKYYDYGLNQGFSAPGSRTVRVSVP